MRCDVVAVAQKDLLHQAEKILIYLKRQNALSHTGVEDSWKLPRKTLECNSAALSCRTLTKTLFLLLYLDVIFF